MLSPDDLATVRAALGDVADAELVAHAATLSAGIADADAYAAIATALFLARCHVMAAIDQLMRERFARVQ